MSSRCYAAPRPEDAAKNDLSAPYNFAHRLTRCRRKSYKTLSATCPRPVSLSELATCVLCNRGAPPRRGVRRPAPPNKRRTLLSKTSTGRGAAAATRWIICEAVVTIEKRSSAVEERCLNNAAFASRKPQTTRGTVAATPQHRRGASDGPIPPKFNSLETEPTRRPTDRRTPPKEEAKWRRRRGRYHP